MDSKTLSLLAVLIAAIILFILLNMFTDLNMPTKIALTITALAIAAGFIQIAL